MGSKESLFSHPFLLQGKEEALPHVILFDGNIDPKKVIPDRKPQVVEPMELVSVLRDATIVNTLPTRSGVHDYLESAGLRLPAIESFPETVSPETILVHLASVADDDDLDGISLVAFRYV